MWDEMYKKGNTAWGYDPSSLLEEVLEQIPTKSNILDLGCGSGRNSKFLVDNGHTVIGLDSSAVAIKQAKKLCDATFIQQDVIITTWTDQTFDVVLDFGFLHCWPKEQLLEYRNKLDSVLKIGGLYIGEQSRSINKKNPLSGTLYSPPFMHDKEFALFSGGYKQRFFRDAILPAQDGWQVYPCYQMLLERTR